MPYISARATDTTGSIDADVRCREKACQQTNILAMYG